MTDANDKVTPVATRSASVDLFLAGFVILFLELACIRFFGVYVIFLQFFSNVILLASFLGMSLGCLAAGRRRDWLVFFPWLSLCSVGGAVGLFYIYESWSVAVTVGGDRSPEVVYFGTDVRRPDLAKFVIPVEVLGGIFFVLTALLFIGPGQFMGRAFGRHRHRLAAYSCNICGSLAGILAFAAASLLQLPPVVWFAAAFGAVSWILRRSGRLTWHQGIVLVTALAPIHLAQCPWQRDTERFWSPYYLVAHFKPAGHVAVNHIGHQNMGVSAHSGAMYSLVHLLQRDAGGKPFENVLVIGAGTGNDVAHALRFSARHVDAVEIDPAILAIGKSHHPDRPYQDQRVRAHTDDGRHFLRNTTRQYDLVIYALVDSLILHSSYANIRLESYLFTEQAFRDVRRVLSPNGVFVTYNFFRQGWVVERIVALAAKVFGRDPLVIAVPHLSTIGRESLEGGFTVIAVGQIDHLNRAFANHGSFWLLRRPVNSVERNGFTADPNAQAPNDPFLPIRIAPARLVSAPTGIPLTGDDWPFLYLREPMVPSLAARSVGLMAGVALALVWWFAPPGRVRMSGRMFWLGAAFMLLETRAVVSLALLFGSTWYVNSVVFVIILLLILCANVYVVLVPRIRVRWQYAALFATLFVSYATPLDVFLEGGLAWRYLAPSVLALAPIFFAGVVFGVTFRQAEHPEWAFGSNIAGSVVGGFTEPLSMLLGFRHLLLVAAIYYLFSIGKGRPA
jgi:spermidine synthase